VDRRDYYSYGQDIGERSYSVVDPYRYSFNGKEDIGEQRWWQDYGARLYHRGLGRFMRADPLIVGGKRYAWLSSYQFASNTPISAIDVDGKEGGAFMKAFEKTMRGIGYYADRMAAVGLRLWAHDQMLNAYFRGQATSIRIDKLSEREKEELFRRSALATKAILVHEFATGTGPAKRTFEEGLHPIVEEVKRQTQGEVMEDIIDELAKQRKTIRGWGIGEQVEVAYEFSPDHTTSWWESIERHLSWMGDALVSGHGISGGLVFGGMRGEAQKVSENEIEVTLYNKMRRGSFYYHFSFVEDRKRGDGRGPLSSTTQIFRYRIKLESKQEEK